MDITVLDKLKGLITNATYQEAITAVQKFKTVPLSYNAFLHDYHYTATLLNQYDAKQHDIFDKTKRKDKVITDDNGQTSLQGVTRLGIPLQKKIVSLSATFLCGNPIEIDYTANGDAETNLGNFVRKIWQDNKLDYKSKTLAKILFSETEVAELWYWPEAEETYWAETAIPNAKYKLRMKLIANSYGDALWPVFDSTGDLIAFGRQYRTNYEDATAGFRQHFDIYTTDYIYKGMNMGAGWEVTPELNIIGKIPIVYYHQHTPDWYEVQDMIDRLEVLISNHADTNDYNGSPILAVTGKIQGFAKKGESGKIVEMEDGAKIQYVTWDHAPESIKLEIENLVKFIHAYTSTPDVSFESMKGLRNISGIALKMLFLDAHMKASEKEEIVGEGIQRRLNYIKTALAMIDVSLQKGTTLVMKPKFKYYLPNSDVEVINTLVASEMAGIISKETAVRLNPLVEDPESELVLLEEQNNATAGLNDLMNQGQPPAKVPVVNIKTGK